MMKRGMGKGLLVKGIMMSRVKRGIQCDKSQIRGLEWGRVTKKKKLKNDRYYYDQNEKRGLKG
jgi:hypothetical protein